MNRLKITTLLLGLISIVTSCVKDTSTTQSINALFPNVQEQLWPYFTRFENEAAIRDLHIDLASAQLTGVISDISTNHVIGQCTYNSKEPNKVTIDQPFWSKATDLGKEFVVFHELGHCILGREHNEAQDPRGVCVSIMRSGTGTCIDNYNVNTRTKYLDELFQAK
ncbi:MAG: hypothetical protein ABI844_05170 [Saprospiraceae bacterium]